MTRDTEEIANEAKKKKKKKVFISLPREFKAAPS